MSVREYRRGGGKRERTGGVAGGSSGGSKGALGLHGSNMRGMHSGRSEGDHDPPNRSSGSGGSSGGVQQQQQQQQQRLGTRSDWVRTSPSVAALSVSAAWRSEIQMPPPPAWLPLLPDGAEPEPMLEMSEDAVEAAEEQEEEEDEEQPQEEEHAAEGGRESSSRLPSSSHSTLICPWRSRATTRARLKKLLSSRAYTRARSSPSTARTSSCPEQRWAAAAAVARRGLAARRPCSAWAWRRRSVDGQLADLALFAAAVLINVHRGQPQRYSCARFESRHHSPAGAAAVRRWKKPLEGVPGSKPPTATRHLVALSHPRSPSPDPQQLTALPPLLDAPCVSWVSREEPLASRVAEEPAAAGAVGGQLGSRALFDLEAHEARVLRSVPNGRR